jgi:hypothetical protein
MNAHTRSFLNALASLQSSGDAHARLPRRQAHTGTVRALAVAPSPASLSRYGDMRVSSMRNVHSSGSGSYCEEVHTLPFILLGLFSLAWLIIFTECCKRSLRTALTPIWMFPVEIYRERKRQRVMPTTASDGFTPSGDQASTLVQDAARSDIPRTL